MSVAEIRKKYPDYADMNDSDFATALHKKYYSDIPFEDFSKKVGLGPTLLPGTVLGGGKLTQIGPAPKPSLFRKALGYISPPKEPRMPTVYDLPEGRKYRTLPPTREEQPFKTLKNISEYYAARYISGLGMYTPDIIAHYTTGAKNFGEALNQETGFIPTRKEEQAGSFIEFMGGIKTATKAAGAVVGKIPVRALTQRIIGGMAAFGGRATAEEVSKRITEKDPISPTQIGLETAIGAGFGLLDAAVGRVKSEVAYKRFIKAHPEAKAYPKKLLLRANEAMSQWFRGLSKYIDKTGKIPIKKQPQVLRLAKRIQKMYGKDLDTLFGRMHGQTQTEAGLAIALKEKVGVSPEVADKAIEQLRKGVPVAEVDRALSQAKVLGKMPAEIAKITPEPPPTAITPEIPPTVAAPVGKPLEHPLAQGKTHQEIANMPIKEYADTIHNPADNRLQEIEQKLGELRAEGGDYAKTDEWKQLKKEQGQLIRLTGGHGLPQAGMTMHERVAEAEVKAKQAPTPAKPPTVRGELPKTGDIHVAHYDKEAGLIYAYKGVHADIPKLEKLGLPEKDFLSKSGKNIITGGYINSKGEFFTDAKRALGDKGELAKAPTPAKPVAKKVVPKGEIVEFRENAEGDKLYVDWGKKRVVKKGLGKGTYYATYFEDGQFFIYQKKPAILEYQKVIPISEQPAPTPAKPPIIRPGFVDLTPIAEAGEQLKTTGEKAAKLVTRFGGVEKKVQKTLIEYEEQLRELPKVAAKDAIRKFGKLTEQQERAIENFREQPAKYPLPEKLRGKYDELEQGIEEFGKRLEALGYPANWPDTYIQRLEKRLEKLKKREEPDPLQEETIEKAIEEARGLRYLHHQYQPSPATKRARQWLRKRITKKPRGVLGRKIPTYEKAGELGLKRAPLAVSYAHMEHEIMRAEAANDLIKAINNNPNLSAWAEDAPEGWVYLDSNIFPESVQHLAWAEEGKPRHKIRRRKYPVPIAESLEELTYARSRHAIARAYDKTNFALKIIGFYNPLVMTKNDLVQMWRAVGLKGLVKLPKAIEVFARKGTEYETLRKGGLFNNVVNYTPAVKELTQQMLDKIRLTSGERAAKIAADWLNPTHIMKDLRRFNEATTWNIDEIIRIAAHESVKDSKMLKDLTEFEKIEWVNDALVNYAKLPKGTKTWLSRFFFVPTYRIGNFRFFWSQLAKHPWRFKGPLLRTVGYKMFVKWGIPAIVTAAVAYKMKDKKDVWTEKGYRVVIHNPETGKDTVYALSDPLLEGAKITQRTLRHTFKVNLAAVPALAHRVLTGRQYPKGKDPLGEFFKIGTPIYRDIVNWKDPDKTTHQKILTQLAIAYVYSRKHRPKDKETATQALAKGLSIWTNWKEQKEDVERMLGTKFYRLMSTEEIVKSIQENTYKKPYRRDGVLYSRGQAHKGQEEHIKKLRVELARRRKK